MHSSFRTLFIVLSLLVSVASAQNAARTDALKAATQSAGVIAAQARVAAAEAQATAAGLPISGSVNAGYGFSGSDPAPPGSNAVRGDWQAGLTLNFAGLYGEANDNKVNAGIGLERAKRGLLAARNRASKNALALWHGVRRAESTLELARQAKAANEQADRAAETRFQAGAINASDRERARAALENAVLDEIRAQSRLESAKLQLEAAFGLKAAGIQGGWTPLPAPRSDANIEAREDVFEARAALLSAELDLDKARRAILPTLNLDGSLTGASGSLTGSLNNFLAGGLTYTYPNSGGSGSTAWSVGLNVRLPLDPSKLTAFGALEASVRAAKASLEASLAAAKADVTAKRAALTLANQGLELANKQLELERASLERTKVRASNGLVTALDVKRAEVEVTRALDAQVAAQAEADNAAVELFEALAIPLEA